MPAIDLLFDVKPSSERLHQMVLGALLVRTELLLSLGGHAPAAESEYDWEPRDGDYDLGLQLEDDSTAWFELKVDSRLKTDQVARQVDLLEEEGHESDQLFYLLLGLSQFRQDRVESVREEREYRVAQRVTVVSPEDLSEAMKELPIETTLGASGGNARSLVSAYRALLEKLERRHGGFAERNPDDWTRKDLHGLYHAFTERIPVMESATFNFAPNPGGGRMVCWWNGRRVLEEPEIELYPQWEVALHKESGTDTRLCFKISVPDDNSKLRTRLRDAASEEVQSVAASESLDVDRPERFGHGEHMTVAVAAPRPVTYEGIDWDEAEKCARGAERIIEAVDLASAAANCT